MNVVAALFFMISSHAFANTENLTFKPDLPGFCLTAKDQVLNSVFHVERTQEDDKKVVFRAYSVILHCNLGHQELLDIPPHSYDAMLIEDRLHLPWQPEAVTVRAMNVSPQVVQLTLEIDKQRLQWKSNGVAHFDFIFATSRRRQFGWTATLQSQKDGVTEMRLGRR